MYLNTREIRISGNDRDTPEKKFEVRETVGEVFDLDRSRAVLPFVLLIPIFLGNRARLEASSTRRFFDRNDPGAVDTGSGVR